MNIDGSIDGGIDHEFCYIAQGEHFNACIVLTAASDACRGQHANWFT